MKKVQTDVRLMAIKAEFTEKIGRFTQSHAYLDVCEEVYGYRIYLFNMMDKVQLDYLLCSVPISNTDTLLELGCGSGSLLRLLTEQCGCTSYGVDLLEECIMERGIPGMQCISGDIDRLSDHGITPTVTLSVDSLYFSRDINALIKCLTTNAGNRLYLFYSQYLFDEADDSVSLQSDQTTLAKALQKGQVRYRTIDYSENERLLYLALEKALCKRQLAFAAENNMDLYNQKLQETRTGSALYEKGRASRYLYIADGVEA